MSQIPVNATGLITYARAAQALASGPGTFTRLKITEDLAGGANSALVATTSGSTTVPASLANFTVVFDTVNTKVLPLVQGYDPTTGVFTAPRDGVYALSYAAGWSSPGPGTVTTPIKVFLFSGMWPAPGECIIPLDTGFFVSASGSTVAILEQGETASVVFVNASGSAISLNPGAAFAITQLTGL